MATHRVGAEIGPIFDGGIIKDAFHGTTASAASAILERGFRVPEGRDREYGSGVYFFEGDYRAAAWHATKRAHGEDALAVLRAEVDLGRTLYPTSLAQDFETLRKKICHELGKRRVEDDEVLQLLTAALQRLHLIDAIKAVRRAKKKWFPEGSRFRAEVVICVFEPERARPVQRVTAENLSKTVEVALL